MWKEYFALLYDNFGIDIFFQKEKLYCIPESKESAVVCDNNLRESLQQQAFLNHEPVIYMEDESIYYGLMYFEEYWICIGPATRNTLNHPKLVEYRQKHLLKETPNIPRLGLGNMIRLLALVYWELFNKKIAYENIKVLTGASAEELSRFWNSEEGQEIYQLHQSENNREHSIGIDFENKIMDIVRAGDVEQMRTVIEGTTPDAADFGEITNNSAKQMEYMLITTLTLITRAAIDGGMNVEDAYSLGDIYLKKISENSGDIVELTRLGRGAQLDFVKKVRQARQNKTNNYYVEKCKDYIAKNLRKKLKVADIGPALGVSGDYLTHKFSELEGITIRHYIIREKCNHAANLLKYSDYPISAIAEYYTFSSQSHFGACFRKIFDMTPAEYRRIYGR